jgi:uncharacterized membrane protein
MSFESLFQSGHIALAILAIMALEAIVLLRYFKRVPAMFSGLAAGACLVLALRAALLQQGWIMIALFLSLSFVFHILEIGQWRRLLKTQLR